MGKTTLWHGVLIACVLSVLSVPLLLGLQWLGGGAVMFITVLGLAYLAYLLAISPSRRGRFVLGLASAAILLSASIASPTAVVLGALVLGLIWLMRSVLFYAGILPALWDAALCALSAVCAVGVTMATHRLWLAVWVFFLLQALFVYIPKPCIRGEGGSRESAEAASQGEAFTRAHRAAEEALQAMAQRDA